MLYPTQELVSIFVADSEINFEVRRRNLTPFGLCH